MNPEMLILAREAKGLTQTALAEGLGVKQGTVSKIEAGILAPSEDLVGQLASILDVPPSFFFQNDRVFGFNSTVFFHRKRQALSDRILRRLHAVMNFTRMRVSRLLRSANVSAPTAFRRLDLADYKSAEEVARLARSMWMIPPGPLRSVTEVIENAGGIVVRFDFETNQIDAISEWVPGFPPIFLVNSDSAISGDRLRLTMAHEIGHMLMHSFPSPTMEEEANEFAAEFLMPRREIKASLFGLNLAKLAQLKRVWKVSMAALTMRAYGLNTITETQRRYIFINFAKRGYKSREPIETDIPIENPSSLHKLTQSHLRELGFSIKEMMELLFFTNERDFLSACVGEVGRLKLV